MSLARSPVLRFRFDRPYGLTHSDKETGFFTECAGYNEVLS